MSAMCNRRSILFRATIHRARASWDSEAPCHAGPCPSRLSCLSHFPHRRRRRPRHRLQYPHRRGAVAATAEVRATAVRPLEAMELRLPLGRSVQMCPILSPLAVSPRGPSRRLLVSRPVRPCYAAACFSLSCFERGASGASMPRCATPRLPSSLTRKPGRTPCDEPPTATPPLQTPPPPPRASR